MINPNIKKLSLIVLLLSLIFIVYNKNEFTSIGALNKACTYDNIIDTVSKDWGKIYITEDDDKFNILPVIKKKFSYKSIDAINTYKYNLKQDKIKTIGYGTFIYNDMVTTVFSVKNDDPKIKYIMVGPKDDMIQLKINKNEVNTITWDKKIGIDELEAIAYDEDWNEKYRYRYPDEISTYYSQDLRWYNVNQ